MGVKGLTSFVEENGHILQDIFFKNSKLVIDGCNLYYLLYFRENLDQIHGGEYDSFECLINRFIQALRDSGIEPFIVLDGGADYTDKKFETLKKRAQDKINAACNASRGRSDNVLPPIIKQVFKEVLTSLKVPFAISIAEADREVALLANEWNCPVLSNDSDFYIFDVPAGFLPITHFKWWKGSSWRCIPAKRFTQERFCTCFNINRTLLPVFAAIAGNDYVNLNDMGLPIHWAEYSTLGGRFARIDGLLRWLSHFRTKNKVLTAVLQLLDDGDKKKTSDTRRALTLGMKEYKISPSSLGNFFRNGTPPSNIPAPLRVLPDWALLHLTQGKLSAFILDVLLFKRVTLTAHVEDASLPSGRVTSRPIRQVIYGLLLGGQRGGAGHQRSTTKQRWAVEEYDRDGLKLTSHMIQPILSGAEQHLQLNRLDKSPQPVRLRVILETLGVTQSLNPVPAHLRLPVSSTCFWLSHAHPCPDLLVLKSLLLGMVYGELRRQRRNHKGLAREEEVVLERFGRLVARCTGKLDLGVAHAYSQWQSCLRESSMLNQLLCFPIPETQCAWLYKGTLVHSLVAELRNGTTPESILAGSLFAGPFYHTILKTVLQTKNIPSIISTETRDIVRLRRLSLPPMDDLSADLQKLALQQKQLEEQEEEAERGRNIRCTPEDDLGWTTVSVKNRHKAKGRAQRVRYPELSNKRDRKGWI